jgi:beta-phosphoglucomutase-like phosphatase (HAD superfamily)
MKYRGVIFDLDGVICSTDEYHYLAWKALADRLNIPFDRERNNLLRGVSRAASLNIILEKSDQTYTDEEKAALAEEKNTLYRELLGNMSTADLSDDVKITLEALRKTDLKLAIGSSSKTRLSFWNRLVSGTSSMPLRTATVSRIPNRVRKYS